MSWSNNDAGWGDDSGGAKGWGNDSAAARSGVVPDTGGWGQAVKNATGAGNDGGWGGDVGGGADGGWGGNDEGGGDGGGGGDDGWGGNSKAANDGGGGDGWGNDGGGGFDSGGANEKQDMYDVDNIEIAPVDWENEEFEEVHGYGYEEHEDVQELTEEDVIAWRNSWHMFVESSDKRTPIPKPIRSFEESKFPEDILALIDSSRGGAFDNPTPIQSQGWPLIMTGKDVIGVAQTGSGKTLAFMLPGVMHIRRNSHERPNCPTVMVQAPTRELARQIADETRKYGKDVKVGHSFGGEGRRSQEYILRSAHVVVGTPGRTKNYISAIS